MNILKGEAMFPRPPRPLPCGAGAALMVLADTHVSELGAQQNREGKLEVTSFFLEPEADMTDISQ